MKPEAGKTVAMSRTEVVSGSVAGIATAKATMADPAFSEGESRTENLGKQTIEGVVAEGTRTTTTIPAGQIGNERPIEIVSERWYSPDLQTIVLSKHRDPRMGESTYKLTNIRRTEPDKSLFEVPASYTIQDGQTGPDHIIMRKLGPPPSNE